MSKNTLEEMRKRLGTISADAASEDEGVIRMRELLNSEDGGLFSGWLKKPEDFGQGNVVVDVGKSVLGTAHDIGANVNNAILKATEALIDTTAYGVGAIGGIFSDDFKQGTKSFIAKDLFGTSATDEAGNPRETTGHIIQKLSPILTGDVLLPLLGGRIEENSVLNQKADSLVESAAHMVGSQALERFVGVPSWLTMGVNSFGGELQEAFGSDAEYGEAGASALISAVAEAVTEKLGGAKFFGGKTASDAVTKFLTKKIGNNIGKYLAKLGIDASMEGAEEVVSGLVSSVGKKMTYMDDKEFSEIFSSQDAFDAFFSGALLGAAGSGVDVAQSKAAGVDPVSKMTVNEEAVVEAVYKDRLSKADKKLTAAEKTKLYDSVIRDMERGQITTGEIEAVLGGDSYKAYQEASAEEKAVLDKLESLYKGDELAQKRQKILQDSKLGQLQKNLSNEVYAKVANDRLAESYREVTRKNEAFTADLNNYPEAQRATVQRAIESGVLNNTNSAHTLVDLVAKLEADLGTTYDFTNNKKLLESGFAIQDATVNGYVKDGKITINVNAAKALDSVIGHEITHVLEGSDLYSALQKAVTAYAKRKGEYDSRMKGIVSLYENVEGYQGAEGFSAMEKELVADMVGDYLFTDTDFVKHLSSADRNLFQRIYDEIKYLCKVVTAGSQEARDLEKVKRLFEQTYRDAEADAERISSFEGDVRYSLAKSKEIADEQTEYANTHKVGISKEALAEAHRVTDAMVDVMMKYSSILPEDKIGKVLTKNGSYDRSVENTTICIRTLAYNEFVDKVQEQIGRPLTQMESFLVSQKLYDIATEPQCMYCYVSLDRKAFNDMLLRYISDRDTVIAKYQSGNYADFNTYSDEKIKNMTADQKKQSLYVDFLHGRKATDQMATRFSTWIDHAQNNKPLLSVADIATEARQKEIQDAAGDLADQLADARKYAQSASWAKIQKQYVAYRDEIRKLGDRVVKNLNEHYGLRWYSFSDYSPAFIVENMQQITDAALRGLKGLSYTKDTDFAEIYAPTRMNINISVFVKQDANGNFYIDERQSANFERAKELREIYPNVGIVATVTNDEALRWAGEQEWSDVIIPFHIVRTGTDVAEYYKWLNYTGESADTIKDNDLWQAYLDSLNLKSESARKRVSKNIYPSEHNNDKETYLGLCESRGLSPRFVRYAPESWYMKLVNETRQSAKNSKPLTPKFSEAAAKASFQKFVNKGGYEKGWYKEGVDVDAEAAEVARDVQAGLKANEVSYGRQDNFDPEKLISGRKSNRTHGRLSLSPTEYAPSGRGIYGEEVRFSLSDPQIDKTYLDAVNRGDTETAQKMVEQKAESVGYTIVAHHGTKDSFTVFERGQDHQYDSGYLGSGFYFTDKAETAEDYSQWKKGYDGARVITAALKMKNPLVIKDNNKPHLIAVQEALGLHLTDFGNYFARPNAQISNAITEEAIRQGYDGIVRYSEFYDETIYVVFDSNQIKSTDAVTYDDNGNVIPLSQRFNPKNDDIRYSLSKVENDGFAPKSRGIYGDAVRFDGQATEVKTQEDPEIDYEPVYRKSIRPTGKLINDIVDEVKKQLPVKRGKTNELRDLIRSYYNGSVDASKLYEEIKSKYGVYTETYVNEQIKDVKRELRSYRLQVSDKIKGDIPDYGDMVRRNRGRVIFANDGVPVDVAYDELNAAYPYFFPATVVNPTDQLLTMLNVANSTTTETQNTPVDDADIRAVVASIESAVTKYRDAKSLTEEQKAIARVDAALDVEKRLVADEMALEFQQLSEEVADKDTYVKGKAKELYDELKSLKKGTRASDDLSAILDRGYDWRSVKTALLNIHDWPGEVVNENSTAEAKIRDIINQGYDEKVSELNQYNERYQERISKLEEEAEEKRQTASRAGRRKDKIEQYTAEAKDIAGDTTHWKDKKLGISYMVNTLRRNLRDIVLKADGSRDIAKADEIYEYLQGDFNRENATVNREATRIKKPYADSKITTAEDAYIQMLGELRHNPETTLTPEVVQEYYKKHSKKIDTAKVEKIISMARNTYDSLFEGINERLREQGMKEIEYRKGYFPHLPNEVGPVAKFFERVLNWKAINNEIPTSIAGMTETFTPHKTYQSFDKSRKSDRTEYSFTKGMDAYVRGALDWIHHLENYQRRRTFENYIRYIHSSEGVQKRIDEIMHSDQYDGDTVWEAIDAVYAEAKNPLHNFVQDLRRGTNAIMNKKSAIDRGTEAMINRSVYSVVSNLSSRVTANMVAGSLSSALTNFIPITQSWAVVSPRQSVIAMGETIRNTVYDDGTIEKSTFLTNRLREAENLYKTFWDKAGEKVTYLMKAIDSFTSQTVWRSKYNTNIESGMSEAEAIADADIFAENVIGGRSRGNMPTIFEAKNPVAKMFTAFQLEVANQYGYMLKDLPQDVGAKAKGNLIKGYGTMFVGAYVYNMLYSALTGRDSAFDPIGIIQGLLEDLDDNEEPEDYADTALQFAEDVVQEVPFIGGLLGGGRIPLSSAMPYGGIQEAFTNTVTDIANEDYKTLTAEWLTPLAYTLLPVGGGQAKKTIQGLQMFFPGEDRPVTGSYTDSGNLRFPVEATPWNVAQAALFGQWASPNAREYFDEQRMPLSPKQTQEYVDVGLPISNYWEYREGLSGLSTLSEKGDYINSLPLTTEQKNILINNVTDRKEPIDMTGADQYPSFEEFDFAMQNPKKYQFLQSIGVDYSTYNNATDSQRDAYNWAANNTTRYAISKTVTDDLVAYRAWTRAINSFEADKDEDGKPVSGSRKEKVEAYISSLPLGDVQKAILLKQAYSTENSYDETIARYVAGLDLTTREKVEILEALGFTVKNGRVEW